MPQTTDKSDVPMASPLKTDGYGSNNALIEAAQNGDDAAVDELFRINMGLVRSIALRFRDRGSDYEDIVQIGSIGMLKAVRSFDLSRGTAFSTYAVPMIIGEIKRFLRDDGALKVGRECKRRGAMLLSARSRYVAEHGREPHLHELAELCGVNVSEAAVALDAVSPVTSIYSSAGGDENDGYTLDKTLASHENKIDMLTEKIALSEALGRLSPLHRSIITLRYFKDYSQQQTADALGLTQVRVSREEKKIFSALRSELIGGYS